MRRSLPALLAGLSVAASMPPWGWWPLTFVGLIAVTRLEVRARESRRRSFAVGAVFGLGWFLPALAWMWFLTAPGFLVAALLFALLHGAASCVATATDSRRFLVVAPAAHTLVEIVRLSFPFGGVPLATLGIAQVSGPLGGVARLGGVIALTWITWQLAALVATWRRPADLRRSVLATCAVVLVVAWVAPRGSDTDVVLDVVAVQGGGPQGTRAIDTDPRDVFERHLDATRTVNGEPDVVVWPENVIDVAKFDESLELVEIGEQAARLGAPFLVGITEDVDSESFTNAQVVVDTSGVVVDRYDKVRRVPFGEYMPLRGVLDAVGAPVDLVPRDAVAGEGRARLDVPLASSTVDTVRASVVISWEVFFGGRAREGVGDGGGIIFNPTNGSSYTWTILQSQQIAASRLRAIETGRWVVQVSPTGFSAFVSPDGDVSSRTAVSETAVIRREVPIRTGDTVYAAIGDRPWIAAAGLASLLPLVLHVTSGRRSSRRRS
ncbi:MAG: apolipoprotein N-acyltransferase [Actinomycetota bacterium]